jgi:hypothetical protein
MGLFLSLSVPQLEAQVRLDYPIVLTQLPAKETTAPQTGGMARADFGIGARIICLAPDGSVRNLTSDFHSACDPDISFDARHILFAGKKTATDPWTIYEMAADGSEVRQVTRDLGDCRSPCYQSEMFTLNSPAPWFQVAFVVVAQDQPDEFGRAPTSILYSCKLDGSEVRRLTYMPASCLDPSMSYDGRLLLAGERRLGIGRDSQTRFDLFGVNLDGTDFALYSPAGPARFRHMACSTQKLVIFVESDSPAPDGSGSLGSVTIRRPLYSYRPLTKPGDGLFHSPSPLADGRILASRRSAHGSDTHAVVRLDPATGQYEKVFDDPAFHDIQARALVARGEPDGRSSVVSEDDKTGKLYCLSVSINDLKDPQGMAPAKKLRIVEGLVPEMAGGASTGLRRRILGEIDIEKDGSFNVEIPAAIPIELQVLDEDGLALRTCRWIWAMNREQRGCIGCHEDPELTPPNVLPDSLNRKSTPLAIPPQERRTVDFRRDVMPILSAKCVTCHTPQHPSLKLAEAPAVQGPYNQAYRALTIPDSSKTGYGKYITPGQARTSQLVWKILGRKTSRPWDAVSKTGTITPMPPKNAAPLTQEEKRTIVEWIDLGALWDGVPDVSNRENR